jgi:hypothetical protein
VLLTCGRVIFLFERATLLLTSASPGPTQLLHPHTVFSYMCKSEANIRTSDSIIRDVLTVNVKSTCCGKKLPRTVRACHSHKASNCDKRNMHSLTRLYVPT